MCENSGIHTAVNVKFINFCFLGQCVTVHKMLNDTDTDTSTFYDTRFFRYRLLNHLKMEVHSDFFFYNIRGEVEYRQVEPGGGWR